MVVTPVTLALRYLVFAVVATVANLAAQRVVLHIGGTQSAFVPALLLGTVVGLVIKYVLDKHWIFADHSTGTAAHGRSFSLYALMGGGTTIIFWGSETLGWLIWQNRTAREVGAIMGLAIGYFVKYRLDRRFVFNRPQPVGSA